MKPLLYSALAIVFCLSCTPKKSKEPAQIEPHIIDVNIHYIRITESNTDTLPFSSDHREQDFKIPFFIKDNVLILEQKAHEEGLSKAKLWVEYVVSFEGKSRDFNYTKYYTFNELPAELKLDSYDQARKEIALKLLDSLSSLEDIRYLPPKIELKEEEFKVGEKKELYSFSQKLKVKKEVLESIPKGKTIDSKTLKTKIIDFGEAEFSTKINIEYLGHFSKLTVF